MEELRNNRIFKMFPIMESNEMILRRLSEDDYLEVEDLFDYHLDRKQALLYIKMADIQFQMGKSILLGVVEKKTSKLVGTIQLYQIHSNEAEIGYRIKNKYRLHSYGTKAVKLVCEQLRIQFQFERIYAVAQKKNIGSIQLLKHCGFQEAEKTKESLKFVKILQ